MTTTADVLLDAFDRVREEVAAVLDGIDERHLTWQPDAEANTIAWLLWHLTRVQDDHLAAAFGRAQLWESDGWADRFGLPFDRYETGYGQGPDEMRQVAGPAALLAGYHEAVARRSAELVAGVADGELPRIVDERWDPPVTLAVRLVSVISDALQHAGQAAYVRGLAERAEAV